MPLGYQIVDDASEAAPPARLGRYEVLGKLATGGMAEILLARLAGDAGFEKIVVVKRLLPELLASRAFVAMFLDEAKLAARLDHPNVCEVFELGRDGADYFLVMPYLDGVAVTELVRRRDLDESARARLAVGVAVQACAGLHHAHELRDAGGAPLGLVHRDVSPSNLFVTTAGVVKLLDFGIAKVRGSGAETEAGMIKGKAEYMAPEQVAGAPLDRRCDVFSLAIVAFEIATGTRLFARDSDYLAARAILEEPIPRADAVAPTVPRALADAIAHALMREPSRRPADALAFARELENALAPAEPRELAKLVTASAELEEQRDRQATVLAHARARMSQVATQPRASGRPWRRPLAIIALAGAGALAAGIALVTQLGGAQQPSMSRDAVVALAVPSPPVLARALDAGAGSVSTEAATPASPTSPTADDVQIDPPTRTPLARGQVSIDSEPWATITVDGHVLGPTPLLHVSLRVGTHHLHAVTADHRIRDLTINVSAAHTAPVVLHW